MAHNTELTSKRGLQPDVQARVSCICVADFTANRHCIRSNERLRKASWLQQLSTLVQRTEQTLAAS